MAEKQQPAEDIKTISPDLAQRIQDELGQNVYLCYQCVKCTSGCPVSKFFDYQPNQIMRALQFGQGIAHQISLDVVQCWQLRNSLSDHASWRGCSGPSP